MTDTKRWTERHKNRERREQFQGRLWLIKDQRDGVGLAIGNATENKGRRARNDPFRGKGETDLCDVEGGRKQGDEFREGDHYGDEQRNPTDQKERNKRSEIEKGQDPLEEWEKLLYFLGFE